MSPSRVPPRLPLVVGEFVFAALWLWAAGTKLVVTLEPYEFAALLVGGGAAAKAALAVAALVEAFLGAAMALRVVSGLRASLGLLVVWTAGLLVARSRAGGALPCGCFRRAGTIDQEITINGVLIGVALALVLWQIYLARGTREEAP